MHPHNPGHAAGVGSNHAEAPFRRAQGAIFPSKSPFSATVLSSRGPFSVYFSQPGAPFLNQEPLSQLGAPFPRYTPTSVDPRRVLDVITHQPLLRRDQGALGCSKVLVFMQGPLQRDIFSTRSPLKGTHQRLWTRGG